MSSGARPRVATTKCIDSARIDISMKRVTQIKLKQDALCDPQTPFLGES